MAKELRSAESDLVGAVAGGGLGLMGGPVGALGGVVFGLLVQHAARVLISRSSRGTSAADSTSRNPRLSVTTCVRICRTVWSLGLAEEAQ